MPVHRTLGLSEDALVLPIELAWTAYPTLNAALAASSSSVSTSVVLYVAEAVFEIQ